MDIVDMEAKRIGAEVREHVRDRFTPGDLESLDTLAHFVSMKVAEVITKTRGVFACRECGGALNIESVRCRHCADPTNQESV